MVMDLELQVPPSLNFFFLLFVFRLPFRSCTGAANSPDLIVVEKAPLGTSATTILSSMLHCCIILCLYNIWNTVTNDT